MSMLTLKLESSKISYASLRAWGKTIGIDEHSFVKNKKYGYKEFASIFVDYNKSRVREVVYDRYGHEFWKDKNLLSVPGRDDVQNVIIDFSPSMRSFAKSFFPNAKIIADKFHLIRLANNIVNMKRLEIMKDPKSYIQKSKKNPLRKMLLMNGKNLYFHQERSLMHVFDRHRELEAFYRVKEMIHDLYRIRGHKRAAKALTRITDFMASLKMKGLKSLRRTLMDWRKEILA